MGPNTTHYASAQVLLLLGVSVVIILIILIVIDEGVIILIGEEIHSLIIQKIIIIAEIGVGVSTKILSGILPFLQLHVPLVDGLLQRRDTVAKTGNNALLLVELTAARLAIPCQHGDGLVLRIDDGRLVVGVVTTVIQLLLTIVHHEAKVVQLSLQLGVVWGF